MLKEELSQRLTKRFDFETWSILKESLWQATDEMFARVSRQDLLCDTEGLLPPLPNPDYKLRVNNRHRCEAAAADLDDLLRQLLREMVMVRVKNSTPEPDGRHKFYYLRVPPGTATAREGIAWTFGVDTDEYELVEET